VSAPDPVLIRQVVPGDLPYIFATWLRDLRDADGGPLPDDLFFQAHRALIERLLSDPSIAALVACAADAPDEILGYVVAEPKETLWWVHTRKPLRNRGLAKRMLMAVEVPPGAPAAWSTPLARDFLKNPPRGRRIRRALSSRSRAGRSPSGAPSSTEFRAT
jgi:GNAT superfamily N-acetyltransferase